MPSDAPSLDTPTATLVILAGGLGTRMGTPKSLLQLDNKPISAWLLDRIAWPGPTMLVTSPALPHPPGADSFAQCAVDPQDGQGPLRGILTALENLSTEMMVVIPVDMPNIQRHQLAWMLEMLVPRQAVHGIMCRVGSADQDIEPFPSAYRAGAKDAVVRRIATGRRSMRQLFSQPNFLTVVAPKDWPPETWTNLNDPESLRLFQSTRGTTSSQDAP
jgi:molybdenum cofactor guanylyltransferase